MLRIGPKRNNRCDGFTFLEILIVMVILSTNGAMLLLNMDNLAPGAQLLQSGRVLSREIRYLRNHEITERKNCRMESDLQLLILEILPLRGDVIIAAGEKRSG